MIVALVDDDEDDADEFEEGNVDANIMLPLALLLLLCKEPVVGRVDEEVGRERTDKLLA